MDGGMLNSQIEKSIKFAKEFFMRVFEKMGNSKPTEDFNTPNEQKWIFFHYGADKASNILIDDENADEFVVIPMNPSLEPNSEGTSSRDSRKVNDNYAISFGMYIVFFNPQTIKSQISEGDFVLRNQRQVDNILETTNSDMKSLIMEAVQNYNGFDNYRRNPSAYSVDNTSKFKISTASTISGNASIVYFSKDERDMQLVINVDSILKKSVFLRAKYNVTGTKSMGSVVLSKKPVSTGELKYVFFKANYEEDMTIKFLNTELLDCSAARGDYACSGLRSAQYAEDGLAGNPNKSPVDMPWIVENGDKFFSNSECTKKPLNALVGLEGGASLARRVRCGDETYKRSHGKPFSNLLRGSGYEEAERAEQSAYAEAVKSAFKAEMVRRAAKAEAVKRTSEVFPSRSVPGVCVEYQQSSEESFGATRRPLADPSFHVNVDLVAAPVSNSPVLGKCIKDERYSKKPSNVVGRSERSASLARGVRGGDETYIKQGRGKPVSNFLQPRPSRPCSRFGDGEIFPTNKYGGVRIGSNSSTLNSPASANLVDVSGEQVCPSSVWLDI